MACINGCTENCFCKQPSPPNPALSDKKVEKDSSPEARRQRLLQAQEELAKTHPEFVEDLKKEKEKISQKKK
jgi:hypothetical protein